MVFYHGICLAVWLVVKRRTVPNKKHENMSAVVVSDGDGEYDEVMESEHSESDEREEE